MDRCKISKWEVVLGAQDRVNIPCLWVHNNYVYKQMCAGYIHVYANELCDLIVNPTDMFRFYKQIHQYAFHDDKIEKLCADTTFQPNMICCCRKN